MTEQVFRPEELEGFGDAARRLLNDAEAQARDLGHARLGTEHLLLGILVDRECAAWPVLNRAGLNLAAARHKVAEAVGDVEPARRTSGDRLPYSARAARALTRAVRFAHAQRSGSVESVHVLQGVLDVEGTAGQVLRGLGVDVKRLLAALDALDLGVPGSGTSAAAGGDEDPPADAATPASDSPAAGARPEPDVDTGAATGVEDASSGPGPLAGDEPGPAADEDSAPDVPDRRGAPGTGIARPTCPRCVAALDDELVYRIVPAFGARGTKDTLVLSCGACGATLGVTLA